MGGGYFNDKHKTDATEALKDLTAISRMRFNENDDEEEEKAYMEVLEYVRVAVMLIREERLGQPDDASVQ